MLVGSLNEAFRLVCDLKLPVLEVLEGIGGGEGTALSLVVELIDYIGKVEMATGERLVKLPLISVCKVRRLLPSCM